MSFKQGLKLGVLISLLPAVLFGLFDVLYTEMIDPQWKANYTNHYLDEWKRTLSPSEYEIKRKGLEDQMALFANPFFQFLLMAVTVFVIGFIVTIISSLALRRKPIRA